MRKRDLTNQRFGRLVALERIGRTKDGCFIWRCKCDCGRIRDLPLGRLTRRTCKTRSCGCLKGDAAWVDESRRLRAANQRELSAWRQHYRQFKNKAKRRNLVFDMSFESFKAITVQPCHYCGSVDQKNWLSFRGFMLHANGIDRKDPKLAYVQDNCLPCCRACNITKNDWPYEEFLAHCRRIAARHPEEPA